MTRAAKLCKSNGEPLRARRIGPDVRASFHRVQFAENGLQARFDGHASDTGVCLWQSYVLAPNGAPHVNRLAVIIRPFQAAYFGRSQAAKETRRHSRARLQAGMRQRRIIGSRLKLLGAQRIESSQDILKAAGVRRRGCPGLRQAGRACRIRAGKAPSLIACVNAALIRVLTCPSVVRPIACWRQWFRASAVRQQAANPSMHAVAPRAGRRDTDHT